MFKSFMALVLIVAFSVSAGPAFAQSQRPNSERQTGSGLSMVKLGVIQLTPGAASDRVDLSSVNGRSSAVKLVAADGSAAIEQVIVTYSNGQIYVEDKKRQLQRKDHTLLIDEREGDDRFIDAVEIVYQANAKPKPKGSIEVWGRQSPSGAKAVRAETSGTLQAVSEDGRLLAQKTLSLLVDRDSVDLLSVANPAGKLRLKAIDAPIHVTSITLLDSLGGEETIEVNADLAPGTPSPWLNVRTSDVRSIRISYRPQSEGGSVSLEVYGSQELPPPPTRRSLSESVDDDSRGYVEVPVFFGTDRARGKDLDKNGHKLAVFTGEGLPPRGTPTLGMSIVTVPTDRESGSISRPEWNLYVVTFALRNEDMKRDFTIQSVDVLPQDAFIAKAKERMARSQAYKDAAMVFVHGFNVNFDDALFRTAQIAHDTGFDGAAFLYSWASKGRTREYVTDFKRTLVSRDYLAAFLEMIQTRTGAKKVHLIAHSMGAQLLSEVLREEKRFLGPDGAPPFAEIIFAAPDVTTENFTSNSQSFKKLAKGVTLYASSNDKALSASGRLADGPPAGLVTAGKPYVFVGVDTVDASAASTNFFALNHSDFADRIPLLLDMEKLFQTGTHPPLKRNPSGFTAIGEDPSLFWRLLKR